MTEIKSEKVSINNSDKNIFTFLSDFNNFEKLMPEQVINWQSTTEKCSFTIKGMADLAMRMSQLKEHSFISYASENSKPFAFTLNSHIENVNDHHTNVQLILNADLNPMLKMMAARPLKNFVNMLTEKLKELLEAPIL